MTRRLPIEPGSLEWRQIITPSKVAAILGVSRWESAYRLWHRMKGLVDPEPSKDIFDIGHDFEPALAEIWKRHNPGWQLSPGEVQVVAGDKFGYPAAATLDRRARRGRARMVVEFKTARHLDEWGDYFTDQAPADYVAQVLAQMAYTGYTRHPAQLLVLGPYFEAHTYVIPYDTHVVAHIHQRCLEFWHSLKSKEPPLLDDSVPTYSCVRELHPEIDAGREVQLPVDLARSVLDGERARRNAETTLRGLKTRVLDIMGSAQYARVDDLLIADRRPHRSGSVSMTLAHKNFDQLLAAHPFP